MLRACFFLTLTLACGYAPGQTQTDLTYQGQIQQTGTLFDGTIDLRFRLFDAPVDGTAVAPEVAQNGVQVDDGVFQVTLDFGDVFGGGDRYLEVEVDGQVLAPRQRVTPAPIAQRALNDQDTTYSPGAGLTLTGTSFALDLDITDARYFRMGGQAITDPAAQFIGSTNDAAFEIRTRGSRHLRIEPSQQLSNEEPITANIVAGSSANFVANGARGATIGGGGAPPEGDSDFPFSSDANRAYSHYATISGGIRNSAGDDGQGPDAAAFVTIAGGDSNEATAYAATIGGGTSNAAIGDWATIAGGDVNDARAQYATVGGGAGNRASAQSATVGGGFSNTARGPFAIVSGGTQNLASAQDATVSGGRNNVASGASSMIPGGSNNSASGTYALAAGLGAVAGHQGSFVWADSEGNNFPSTAADQFSVRAQGGVRFIVGTTNCSLSSGDADWVCSTVSDRNAKTDLELVDADAVLKAVTHLPIYRWRYRNAAPSDVHLGPMAQDFRAAFESVGGDDARLNTLHLASAALAAVQALEQRQRQLLERVAALEQENRTLRLLAERLDRLEIRLEARDRVSTPGAPVAVSQSSAMVP